MKKIIFFAASLMLLFSITNSEAATFTNTSNATTTVLLNGIGFKPSTSCELAAIANTTAWAAQSKHTTGGTSTYGLLSTDTNITIHKGEATGSVTAPSSATALSITAN